MEVRIETRSEYELFIKQKLFKRDIPNKTKELIQQTLMEVFDDGVQFAQGRLVVEPAKL